MMAISNNCLLFYDLKDRILFTCISIVVCYVVEFILSV